MGTPLAGVGGAVKNTTNAVANIDTWSVDAGAAVSKTTSFGATGSWETNQATLKNWTAKCSGRVDPADTNGQVAFLNGLGNTFSVSFFLDTTKNWAGSGILTTISPKVAADGLGEVEFTFTGTGALTVTLT